MSFNKPIYSEPICSEPVWLCLSFPTLPLDIFCRDQQEAEKPLVVTEKQKVHQCNAAAVSLGIRTGQSMDTAFSLSDQVTSIERQTDKETATLQHLAQWAYQFTPNVSVKPDNCLVLEVGSSLKLFHGLSNLCNQIEQGIQKQGYRLALGIAQTPAAAILLAQARPSRGDGDINRISVEFLQTTEKVVLGLQQMGIQNLGQVLALPISGINRRFGTFFGDYLLRLTGEKPDPQNFISEQARFYHSVTFLHDVNNLSALTFPVNRLLGELSDFLTQRQFWINHLTWHLCHRAHPRQSFSVHLATPVNNIKMFLTLTQLKLDQIQSVKEIDTLALSVKQFFPAGQLSSDLFSGKGFDQQLVTDTTTEQQDQLLNMLNAKLGEEACFGLSENNDYRPEKAWKKIKPGEKDYWNPAEAEQSIRPTFLLPAPKALEVIDDTPCLGGKLSLLKGPERIDFGWWDQPLDKPLTRDYYIARQKQGALLWIFKYLSAERWYLHGIFS